MQTISLSKTEQALVMATVEWVESQQNIINRIAQERVASILEEHELVGKAASFSRQEDGTWVLQISEESDAAQEGNV